jgi:hypothetical protein
MHMPTHLPTPARRPLIDPLLLALKSRRVIVALCTLGIGLLTLALPELKAVQGELLTLLITLALALITGYSVEDAARAARERTSQPLPDDLRALLRELLADVLAERAEGVAAAAANDLPDSPSPSGTPRPGEGVGG